MAETTNTGTPAPDTQPEKTFTQEDVNKIVGDRIAREREKFADYDAIKAKAEKLDEMEEANKTELQKALEKVTALQTELDGMKTAEQIRTIRDEVAKETQGDQGLHREQQTRLSIGQGQRRSNNKHKRHNQGTV